MRVPLLVRGPGVAEGRVCEALVEWIDLGPTLVAAAGGEVDYLQFGRSLWPVLEDPQNEHRREAVSEHEGEIMLLDREWKAALTAEGQVYLLFDVQDDPEEAENLAGRPEMAQVESGLRGRLLEHLVSTQLVGFSLVSNLVLPIGTIMAERLLYLPSGGFLPLGRRSAPGGLGVGAQTALPARLCGAPVVLFGAHLDPQRRLAR